MDTYVYAWGDNRVQVGILRGRLLYDNSGCRVVACTDAQGRLYNSPNADGAADYVLVGDCVREHSSSGVTAFTIRGNTICDGIGPQPTFHCVTNSPDNRLALALTAIANIGDLRFRSNDANIASPNSYVGWASRKKPDSDLDYSKVYGSNPDPFKNRTIPPKIAGMFESSYDGSSQSARNPPQYKERHSDNETPEAPQNSQPIRAWEPPLEEYVSEPRQLFSPEEDRKKMLYGHRFNTKGENSVVQKSKNNYIAGIFTMIAMFLIFIGPLLFPFVGTIYFESIWKGLAAAAISPIIGAIIGAIAEKLH